MTAAPSPWVIAIAAIRPQTLPAAAAPVVVGAALAMAHGAKHMLVTLAALFVALFIQIFANLYNDVADFRRGADTEDRLGPDRVTQKGWMTEKQVLWACALSVALALVMGAYLTLMGGVPILAVGLVSLVFAYLYTGGPAPLAYTGLGDIFVLIFFGEVAVCGTYYLITGGLEPAAYVAGLVVGLPTTAILVVNNLRDQQTDAEVGKRTLVVRLGSRFGRFEYAVCLLGAQLAVAFGLWFDMFPTGAALALLGLPLALRRIVQVNALEGARLNPLLGQTARHGLIVSVLLSVGVLL
jgi:1,4-dihydroxy-2-naphthoate polyprenyltransferase